MTPGASTALAPAVVPGQPLDSSNATGTSSAAVVVVNPPPPSVPPKESGPTGVPPKSGGPGGPGEPSGPGGTGGNAGGGGGSGGPSGPGGAGGLPGGPPSGPDRIADILFDFSNGPEAYGLAASGDTSAPNQAILVGVATNFAPHVQNAPRASRRAIAMTLATISYDRFPATGGDGKLVFKAIFAIALSRLDTYVPPPGTTVLYSDSSARVVDDATFNNLVNDGAARVT